MAQKSVLVVDDSPGVRSALCKFLTRHDYGVCGEAVDGLDAVHKTEKLNPDLILMDLSMPNLTGAAAASVIRRTHPKTRIIVFTLYADTLRKNLARALGVDLVVDKAAGSEGLTGALQTILSLEN